MNGAKFKIIRENLNFSISESARFFKVSERTIRRWDQECSSIPDNVANIITDINNHLDKLAWDYSEKIISENSENSKELNIKKHLNLEDYRAFINNNGCCYRLPLSTQNYFIYNLMKIIENNGIKTKIIPEK